MIPREVHPGVGQMAYVPLQDGDPLVLESYPTTNTGCT